MQVKRASQPMRPLGERTLLWGIKGAHFLCFEGFTNQNPADFSVLVFSLLSLIYKMSSKVNATGFQGVDSPDPQPFPIPPRVGWVGENF